jgi:hypothetical protein
MEFAENVHADWQEGYCFIMTVPDLIQPKYPGREFKNCSGNFLNIRLRARTWPNEGAMNGILYGMYGSYGRIPERKRTFGKPWHRWAGNIKMELDSCDSG